MAKTQRKKNIAIEAMPFSHCTSTPIPFQSDGGSNATATSTEVTANEINSALDSVLSAAEVVRN
jgi:hypothetical protein